LDPLRIVNLALETGCDAIHPGYGFLSENADLARLCEQKGITFVGPSSSVIQKMGDKTEARDCMRAAGIPVTPGSEGNLKDLEQAIDLARTIGYPVMIKATSGGGGRGIRRCESDDDLRKQYPRVISEAEKAFGSAEIFLEKCIVNPRHIEVQVLADRHGNVIHLYERDCSIQRRNQKLIEIAPSPQLSE
jgi:pyruvate carboxylase subunit A